ncbi:MAG TPA: hypothetical protein VLB27_10215, partial [candidate division Zixibacteria bacterium]|nr:hypothetical protein [candidate division Zixibacteria bacterium]
IRDAAPIAGVGGSGGSVRDLELQEYRDTLTNAVDSVFLWTANQPTSDSGVYISFRIRADVSFLTVDTFLFAAKDPGARVRDLSIKGETVLYAGNFGVRTVVQADPNFGGGYTVQDVDGMIDRSREPALGLVIDTAETIFQADGATHIGARAFFGVSRSADITREGWRIAFGNIFDFTPDSLAVYRTNNSNLSGNFIPAMGIQYRSGMAPVIWAACRPGSSNSTDGGCFDVRALRQVSYLDLNSPNPDWVDVPSLTGEVWNFAFDGDAIFAASTEGLYWAPNAQTDFVRDSLKSSRPLDIVINDSASVNGVAVIDTNLWVTTEDGFAVRGLNEAVYDIFKVRDTGGGGGQVVDEIVYAYPVPYDYNNDNPVQFRYQVPVDANTVTIEIYDFAMNLVSRVVDNEARTPGVIYDTKPSDAWSGQNDENELVAPGIYYFKISFSNGELRWGKLAVIPGR